MTAGFGFSVPPACLLQPQAPSSVRVFDTTLRDGVDGLGTTLSRSRRVKLALALADLGPDVLEAGYTQQPNGLASIEAVASALYKRPSVHGMRTRVAALVPRNSVAVRDAACAGAAVLNFFARPGTCNLEELCEHIHAARVTDGVEEVQFTVQGATAAGCAEGEMCDMIKWAHDAGASTIGIADSSGRASPALVRALVLKAGSVCRGANISFHGHNDLGLALANSLAAVENGANQVEVTLGGIGTRCGNCALEELAVALPVCFPGRTVLGGEASVAGMTTAFRLLQDATGLTVGDTKPIFGRGSRSSHLQLDT